MSPHFGTGAVVLHDVIVSLVSWHVRPGETEETISTKHAIIKQIAILSLFFPEDAHGFSL